MPKCEIQKQKLFVQISSFIIPPSCDCGLNSSRIRQHYDIRNLLKDTLKFPQKVRGSRMHKLPTPLHGDDVKMRAGGKTNHPIPCVFSCVRVDSIVGKH